MDYDVYIDMVIAMNLAIDTYITLLVIFWREYHVKKLRIAAGILVDSFLCTVPFFFPFLSSGVWYFCFVLLGSIILTLILHGTIDFFVSWWAGYLLLGALLMIAMQSHLIVPALLGVPILTIAGKWWSVTDRKRKLLYHYLIRMDSVTTTGTGFLDTGNQLYDPVTGYPVIIMSMENAEHWLPQSYHKILEQSTGDITDILYRAGQCGCTRMRIIPYHTIDSEDKFMPGILVDSLWVWAGRKKWSAIKNIHRKKAVVAIAPAGHLSTKVYQCILHPDVMSGNKY